MDAIIYTKYSTERRPELCIKTHIMLHENEKYVLKVPASETAQTHIDQINKRYFDLTQLYQPMGICINTCSKTDQGIRLEYIEGITYEEILDELLTKQDYLGIIEKIKIYKQKLLDCLPHHLFVKTEEFCRVFGNMEMPMMLEAVPLSDIDLIFSNVVIDHTGKWNIIDFEWTFAFDIPVNFILYRAISDYLYRSNKRDAIWHLDLLQLFGITEAEKNLYEKMNQAFYDYVNGNVCSIGTLSNKMNKTKYIVKDLLVHYIPGQVQVFYDYGDGYSEECSEFINCSRLDDGMYMLHLNNFQQVKSIRIDPTNQYCIIDIKKFITVSIDGESKEALFYNNGEHLSDTMYVYNTDDPQWVIPDVEKLKEIEVDFYIANISKEIAGICSVDGVTLYNSNLELKQICAEREMAITNHVEQCEEQQRKLREQEKVLNEQKGEITKLAESIEALQHTVSWKITKPLRVIRKIGK